MADTELQQVHQMPGNSFPRSLPWRQNHVLGDARVSLNIAMVFLEDAHLSMHGAL